jgi:outer membrane lipoprotein-sorting protein
MKFHLLALPLVALWSLSVTKPALAAPLPTAPSPMPPAAKALLSAAIKTYQGASGISFRFAYSSNFEAGYESSVWYLAPNKLRVERHGENPVTQLFDGKTSYLLGAGKWSRWRVPAGKSPLSGGFAGRGGRMIGAMMAGRNPIEAIREPYASEDSQGFTTRTVLLPARVVDGEVLRGVQDTFSFRSPAPSKRVVREETTAWFGGSPPTLRRVQIRTIRNGETTTAVERIGEQQLSPTFPADSFVFNPAGLNPMELKVGPAEGDPVETPGTAPAAR